MTFLEISRQLRWLFLSQDGGCWFMLDLVGLWAAHKARHIGY